MKRRLIQVLTLSLIVSFLISCGTGRMMGTDERYNEIKQSDKHCGFGEETGEVNGSSENGQLPHDNLPPAAERSSKIVEKTPELGSNEKTQNEELDKTENAVSRGELKEQRKHFRAERKAKVKSIYKALKEHKKKSRRESGAMLIVLVILALLIPPLAVGIYEGITGRFWLVLILWLIGIGLGWWLLGFGLGWLCGLVAVIMALLIVLGVW